MRRLFMLTLLVAGLAASAPARATYSIVATDSATGEVGGGGTSCVGSLSVFIIYGGVPGVGAVHAQAWVNIGGRDQAVQLLQQGTAPADVIAAITAPGFDIDAALRQYGVVDLSGRAAGWTGALNDPVALDRQGQIGTFTWSAQGNILTSTLVIDQTQAGFESGGCDLAERLMLALEAGAQGGEGDSRCTVPFGTPSDSAFLHVDAADGSSVVHLNVVDTAPVSPLIDLRLEYDSWRGQNPCPVPPGPDAGVGADAAAVDDATIDDAAIHDAAIHDIHDNDGGPGLTESGGCGCRGGGGDHAPLGLSIVILLVLTVRLRYSS